MFSALSYFLYSGYMWEYKSNMWVGLPSWKKSLIFASFWIPTNFVILKSDERIFRGEVCSVQKRINLRVGVSKLLGSVGPLSNFCYFLNYVFLVN